MRPNNDNRFRCVLALPRGILGFKKHYRMREIGIVKYPTESQGTFRETVPLSTNRDFHKGETDADRLF